MSGAISSVLLFTATISAALGQEPVPKFLWRLGLSDSEMVAASQVIVVGRVRALNLVGSKIGAADDQGYRGPWQLVKIEADNDAVLKGDISAKTLEFFYYASLGPVMGDWNDLQIGDRCVFFLIREDGRLRAVRDFWRSSIEVGTGRPTSPMAGSVKAGRVKERIATLLLTPGDGLEPKRLARGIFRAVPLADEWIGECPTTKLLQNLLKFPSSVVQDAARGQLNSRSELSCDK